MVLGLLIVVFCTPVIGNAATNPNGDIGFSVSAQLPNNQRNRKSSFFDLNLKSGESQLLKVTIYNATKRDMKVKTGIHTAYTNSNGVIEYITPAKRFDPSLKYRVDLITHVQGSDVVVVPANGSKVVEAFLEAPKMAFTGVMLGGWYFQKIDEKVTSEVTNSMNVRNQYAYVIGMKYSFGQTVAPKMSLDKVELGLKNHHTSLLAYLRNTAAVIIPDINLETKIINKKSGKVIKISKKSGVQMAPNSSYDYPFMQGEKMLKAGKYHIQMVAKNKHNRWVLEKDFTITSKEVKKYSRESVENKSISPYWFVIIGALLMLIVGGVIGCLYAVIKKRRHTS